tara:strand:- start:60 stop:398 length:339 start_codon:yes stop_codon:yes gene_type:complete
MECKPMTNEIDKRVNDLVLWLNENYRQKRDITFTCKLGKKYYKIIENDNRGQARSVYCFIDSTNGNILKANSWNSPHKKARGSVLNDNESWKKVCLLYGIVYANGYSNYTIF